MCVCVCFHSVTTHTQFSVAAGRELLFPGLLAEMSQLSLNHSSEQSVCEHDGCERTLRPDTLHHSPHLSLLLLLLLLCSSSLILITLFEPKS